MKRKKPQSNDTYIGEQNMSHIIHSIPLTEEDKMAIDKIYRECSVKTFDLLRSDGEKFARLSKLYADMGGIRFLEECYNDSLLLYLMSYICGISESGIDFFPRRAAMRINLLAYELKLSGKEVANEFVDLSTDMAIIRFDIAEAEKDICKIAEAKNIKRCIRKIEKKYLKLQ